MGCGSNGTSNFYLRIKAQMHNFQVVKEVMSSNLQGKQDAGLLLGKPKER